MATYKGIKGFSIQNLSADPSNPIEGEMWYNSTSNVWKVEELTTAGSWATGNNLNTGRRWPMMGTMGTQTEALCVGGASPTASAISQSEEYNGSSWAVGGSLNTARGAGGGCGTQTAGLAMSGYTYNPVLSPIFTGATEEYNGTTWANSNSLNTNRYGANGGGIQTAAIAVGGNQGGGTFVSVSEEYDGTNWTSGGSLPTNLSGIGVAGTQTATLGFGGDTEVPAAQNSTLQYDGTSWTSVPATLNTARQAPGSAGTQKTITVS
jgi:hypothetical protein